jgi:hypothetical protein
MESSFDALSKELRELVRAADLVLQKTKAPQDTFTDFELRVLENYIVRLHSGLAFAKTAAQRRQSQPPKES